MNDFEKLKNGFLKRIEENNQEILNCTRVLEVYNLTDSYFSPDLRLKEYSERLNGLGLEDYKNTIVGLSKVEELINNVENKYKLINYDEVCIIIEMLDLNREYPNIKINLKTILDFQKLGVENNSGLIAGYNQIKEEILKDLKLAFNNLLKQIIERVKTEIVNLEDIKQKKSEENEKLNHYLTLFSNKSIIKQFDSANDMIEFFNFLRTFDDGSIDVFNLILDFCKYNINELQRIPDRVQETILGNAEEARNTLESAQEPSEAPMDISDLVKTFTEEEKQIWEKINNILVENRDTYILDSVDILENDYEIGTRKDLYFNGDKLDIDIVITDINKLLIPNLSDNREQIFKIFTYIIECYDKYKTVEAEKKRTLEERNKPIIGLIEEINKIIKDNAEMLYEYSRLDEMLKNFYAYIIHLMNNEGKISAADVEGNIMSAQRSKEYFERLSILLDLQELQSTLNELISLEEIKEEDMKFYHEQFESLKNEYDMIDASDKSLDKLLEHPKNLVYFMENDFDSFEESGKKELEETTRKLLSIDWVTLKSMHVGKSRNSASTVGELRRKKSNGKWDNYSKESFKPLRITGNNNSRTGVIQIFVCPENREKIKRVYNAENTGFIVLIMKPIMVNGADHSDYDENATKYISSNRDKIDYFVNLFNNPDADEKELYGIIEQGFTDVKKLCGGQKGQGDKGL